jgi:hypothetical protein
MERRLKVGALVFGVIVAGVGGVALWMSGDLETLRRFVDPSSDAGDTDGPVGDGAAALRHQTAPLSSAQLGAPLVHGGWITACGAPETMKVVVKLDVKGGRAMKVDVSTDPPDPSVTACVQRAAQDLRWDVSPKVGHVAVTY